MKKVEIYYIVDYEKNRNLLHHSLQCNKLVCKVNDKLEHIKESENQGANVIAIFEDGSHHIDKL